jgi:hypothetical protein
MNGLTLDIQGGNPGRSQNNHVLLAYVAKIAEQGRLARTRPTSDEYVPGRVFHHIESTPEFIVQLYVGRFIHVRYKPFR